MPIRPPELRTNILRTSATTTVLRALHSLDSQKQPTGWYELDEPEHWIDAKGRVTVSKASRPVRTTARRSAGRPPDTRTEKEHMWIKSG